MKEESQIILSPSPSPKERGVSIVFKYTFYVKNEF
jgi:hypothetical protein